MSQMIDKNKTAESVGKSKFELAIDTGLLVFSLAGMGIATYLTYVHYFEVSSICLFNANCDVVLTSPFAEIWGISLSAIGLLMYTALAIFSLALFRVRDYWKNLVSIAIYGLALTGILFTIYLYYLEVFVLHDF